MAPTITNTTVDDNQERDNPYDHRAFLTLDALEDGPADTGDVEDGLCDDRPTHQAAQVDGKTQTIELRSQPSRSAKRCLNTSAARGSNGASQPR